MLEVPNPLIAPRPGTSVTISPLQFLWRRRDPLLLLAKLAGSSGDLVRIRVGRQEFILLQHPDFIQKTLVADVSQIEKGRTGEREIFFTFLGNGLLNARGEAHRRQRRLMLPAFHRARLTSYAETMVNETATIASHWQDDELRDINSELMAIAVRVIGRTLFSASIGEEADVITNGFAQLTAGMSRLNFPGARWLLRTPLPFARKLVDAQRSLDAAVHSVILRRRQQGTDEGDLLSMLLAAEDADHPNERMTDAEVRDQVMTLLFTGQAPIGDTLTWALWLLAAHPAHETALNTEIQSRLRDRDPTIDDLPYLPFTEQIIRETLRLYPPLWVLGRRTLVDLVYNGESVKQGSLLLISQWITQRDPRWFPAPDNFEPSRWTSEFRSRLPRYAYFPFGGGHRSCIGENFAWMELVLILATLARRWRFSLSPSESLPIRPHARITLHPDQRLLMRVHRRTIN